MIYIFNYRFGGFQPCKHFVRLQITHKTPANTAKISYTHIVVVHARSQIFVPLLVYELHSMYWTQSLIPIAPHWIGNVTRSQADVTLKIGDVSNTHQMF